MRLSENIFVPLLNRLVQRFRNNEDVLSLNPFIDRQVHVSATHFSDKYFVDCLVPDILISGNSNDEMCNTSNHAHLLFHVNISLNLITSTVNVAMLLLRPT